MATGAAGSALISALLKIRCSPEQSRFAADELVRDGWVLHTNQPTAENDICFEKPKHTRDVRAPTARVRGLAVGTMIALLAADKLQDRTRELRS